MQAGWGKLIIDSKIWITMSFFCIFSDWIVGLINGKINRPKNQLLSENATTWIHNKDVVHFTIQTFCTTVNYWEEGPNFDPPPPPKKRSMNYNPKSCNHVDRQNIPVIRKLHKNAAWPFNGKKHQIRVVTKISSCRVFVVSSRGSRKQSWTPPPPL